MTPIDIIIYTIGFIAVSWWLLGFVLFTFFAKVYVAKGAPLGAKVSSVLHAGVLYPYFVFRYGKLPMTMIAPTDPDPEEKARMDAFMAKLCPCEKCRRNRGETE